MTNLENTPESAAEARKAAERAQQANWFLGGTVFVVATAAGISAAMARNENLFAFIGVGVGVIAFWAITRFAKK